MGFQLNYSLVLLPSNGIKKKKKPKPENSVLHPQFIYQIVYLVSILAGLVLRNVTVEPVIPKGRHRRSVPVRCGRYLDEVTCYVPPGDVEASGQVRQREALVDRADVSDAVTGVHHHASQESWQKTKWIRQYSHLKQAFKNAYISQHALGENFTDFKFCR